jgi:hypothetical protein
MPGILSQRSPSGKKILLGQTNLKIFSEVGNTLVRAQTAMPG